MSYLICHDNFPILTQTAPHIISHILSNKLHGSIELDSSCIIDPPIYKYQFDLFPYFSLSSGSPLEVPKVS